MPDDPPIPAPAEPPKPAPTKARRPPAPRWMWLVFGLALVPVGALICIGQVGWNSGDAPGLAAAGAVGGLLLGLPMLGGLAIAVRFFDKPAERFVAGVILGLVVIAGLAGVAFAGCMCLFRGSDFH